MRLEVRAAAPAPDGTMRDLYALSTAELKMDLKGWQMHLATDVSPDGTAVVGMGTNEKKELDTWLIELPAGWWKKLPAREGGVPVPPKQ